MATKKPLVENIYDDEGKEINLPSLTLPQLADVQKTWKEKLAAIPRVKSELVAINAQIRARGK